MSHIEMHVGKGDYIHHVCNTAVRVSGELNIPVKFTFNGIEVYVEPADSADSVHDRWSEINRRMAEEARKKADEMPRPTPTLDELAKIAMDEWLAASTNHWRKAAKAVAERLGHHIEEEP